MLGGEPLKHECTVDDLVAQVNLCLSVFGALSVDSQPVRFFLGLVGWCPIVYRGRGPDGWELGYNGAKFPPFRVDPWNKLRGS